MNKQPFFTVGIPLYNAEKYLTECIDSVLSQSFSDFEILIVNDGSSDKSLITAQNYSLNDNRIRIISRENQGVALTRNTIIYNACGRYLYMLDSDDTMCPDTLMNAYNAICKYDNPDILHTRYYTVSNGKLLNNKPFNYPEQEYFLVGCDKNKFAINFLCNKMFSYQLSTKFISADFIKRNGIMFSSRYTVGEDREFTINLFRKANTIAYVDFCSFTYYFPREGSLMSTPSFKNIASEIYQWTDLLKDSQFWNVSDKERDLLKKDILSIAEKYRQTLIDIFHSGYTKTEIFNIVNTIDSHLGKYIKSLPIPHNSCGIIFLMYRIIGIKHTTTILYKYFKIKGLIK